MIFQSEVALLSLQHFANLPTRNVPAAHANLLPR
jgi:hypothetical protein